MRNELNGLGVPTHLGLAYGSWAPAEKDKLTQDWLSTLAGITTCVDYAHAFERWKASFTAPGDHTAIFTLASRLLIGHGNASPTEVGLSVHHTWGVPIIPGSALKGLLAHYVEATYGADDVGAGSPDQAGAEEWRERFRGITWRGRRIARGPGDIYRALFGSPDADDDRSTGASQGRVTFHDALYVPKSAPADRPFAVDVLTVHQKTYYDSGGGTAPSDHDDPIPVTFLTVRPRVRFLLALSGPDSLTVLAVKMLEDALKEWGAGGKTAAGYGRGYTGDWSAPTSGELGRLLEWLAQQRPSEGYSWRAILNELKTRFGEALSYLNPDELEQAADAIRKKIRSNNVVAERDAFLDGLRPQDRGN